MFLRIDDRYNIQKKKGFLQYLNAKRKHQEVKKFKIDGSKVSFFDEELETKMIPKKEIELLDINVPLIFVLVGSTYLFFQDVNKSVNFLTIDDDGEISKIPALELSADDDILIYDEEEDDYLLSPVTQVEYFCYADLNKDTGEYADLIDRLNDNRQKVLDELSKYIIFSNHGIIVNKILLI